MFKGFGKPKYTADERQLAGGVELVRMFKTDNPILSQVNAGNNEAYIVYPKNDGFLNDKEFSFSVATLPVRWDLLNPGCPDLVGIRMFTKPGRLKILDASRNCFTAVYDRSKKLLSYALSIDELDLSNVSKVTMDLNAEEATPVEAPDRNAMALKRFTNWTVYELCTSSLPKGDLDTQSKVVHALREKMGSDWDEVFVSV